MSNIFLYLRRYIGVERYFIPLSGRMTTISSSVKFAFSFSKSSSGTRFFSVFS